MSSDFDEQNNAAKQLLDERQHRLEAALDLLSREGADVTLKPETKREIVVHILNYHRVISKFAGESVLTDGDIPDISPIRNRLGRTTEVVVESKRGGGDITTQQRPAVDELDVWYLEDVANQLEVAAKKLGFWANAEATRPLYDAGKRDNYPDPVHPDIPKPKTGGGGDGALDLRHSKLYHDWYQRVASGDPNDYVIAISADPRSTGVSGSGKTTFGGGLAKRWFDYSDDGFNADIQYTLDAAKLAYDLYEETGELSVLIGDEMQGTPATTGLNAKRSQKSEALDAVNAIAAGRSDRKTVILIVQDLKSLNKDALTFIDAWLLIRDDYDYIATHYSVAPDVFDLGSRETKTPGVEQITWDALPDDDPDYQVMEEKKAAAKRGEREYSDDDSDSAPSMPQARRDQLIRRMDAGGMERGEIADEFGLTPGRISQIVNSDS
jgi:hypothetical protein